MPVKDPRHWLLLLDRLAELARRQRELCERGALAEVLDICERRQTIARLLGDRVPEGLTEAQLQQVRRVIHAILLDDRVAAECLERRRLELLEAMAECRRGARALAGYREPRLAHALDVRE